MRSYTNLQKVNTKTEAAFHFMIKMKNLNFIHRYAALVS